MSVDSTSKDGQNVPIHYKKENNSEQVKYKAFNCYSHYLLQNIFLLSPRSFIKTVEYARTRLIKKIINCFSFFFFLSFLVSSTKSQLPWPFFLIFATPFYSMLNSSTIVHLIFERKFRNLCQPNLQLIAYSMPL